MGGIRRGWNVRRSVCGGIVASALVFVVAGCQEGVIPVDPAASPPAAAGAGTTGPGTTGPAAQPTQATVAPARILHAGDYVLTAGEETAGFESSGGADEDSDSSAIRAQVAACVGVPDYNPSPPSDETTGDTFTNTEESDFQAISRAKILPESQIRQNAEIVTSPGFGDCYRTALEDQLAGEDENGFTYEIVAVETPPPPRGATALVRTSMGITDEYGTYGYVFDTIYFYVGQVAVELDVTNIQDVPPPVIEQGLIDQIADKLTDQ
ncbi:hypothetical protein MXD62_32585 [Frankia sp. Mgl5]|uniref:hypothetical protein n=1 Tax=Frankia sp. Mgl5 TaxID=2933793 RepID=UPI002010A8D5|nr:hypothetical protein [Frankia sp. Mgl5]MCK9931821.1 hypothetical protein [Frankia sp. Mgl5]